jgi:hypothetical protein
VTNHLDDFDLIALLSGTRAPDEAMSRHLATCGRCQRRQAELARLVAAAFPAGDLPEGEPAATPRPRPRPRGRRLFPLAVGLLLLALFFWEWPHLAWPGPTPSGPVSLALLTAGHRTELETARARGTLTLAWTTGGRWALLSATGLPAPLPGHVYELWWVEGRRHIRAGILRPADGRLSLWLRAPLPLGRFDAVGVTLEPAPGRPRPTGPRLFFALLADH